MKHLLIALFACVMAVGQTVITPNPGEPLRIPAAGAATSLPWSGLTAPTANLSINQSTYTTDFTGTGRFTFPAAFGIGTGAVAPAVEFEVNSSSTSSPRGIMSAQFSTGTDGARLHTRKARGTRASPTTVATGDTLGRWIASGYDGSNYLEMGSIDIVAAGTIASTRVPTELRFYTATDAAPSVLTQRMVIDKAGNVGIGTTGPGYALDVVGSIRSSVLTTSGAIPFVNGTNGALTQGGLMYDGNSLSVPVIAAGGSITAGNGRVTIGAGLSNAANGAIYSASGKSLEIMSDGTAGRGMIIQTGNGNVGIGTTFPTGAPAQRLTTVGSIFAYDMSTLGAEKATSDATCTGWTLGAGWACASGVITHTAGNTATATYTASVIAGNVYRLTLTSTGRTAGSVTPSLGGVAGAANSAATLATYDIATTGTGALTLTPTTDFDGAITVNGAGQISVKPGLASTISAKSISHRPIVFADLGTVPSPKNGDQLYCGDCTYGARGDAASGSGTGAFLGYVNGAWKNM